MAIVRFTVTKKIVFGLAAIAVIGIAAMLVIYAGLNAVGQAVHKLAVEEQPFNAAAYEMEVNVNGIGFALMKYLTSRNPQYRAWVEEDHSDFKNYHATYLQLTKTERERELAARVGVLYADYSALADVLMRTRDQQEAQFTKVSMNIERIDRIIDDHLQPAASAQKAWNADRFANALSAANLEADIAELGFWVASYHGAAKTAQSKALIYAKLKEFGEGLLHFKGLGLSAEEERLANVVSVLFEQTAEAINTVVALEDLIVKHRQEFIDRRVAMDQLFDDQIQPLAMLGLSLPREQADEAAHQVLRTMRYLIPAFLFSAALVGFLFIRFIILPLNALQRGTEAISSGDLTYRIAPGKNDEFGDLATRFNRMVEELESTTVSRVRLLESEKKLQQSVADLRHEIGERERAEQERRRLEADLRRNEAMSEMGALTAGVAHEVRNPLFGISSTLDAMEVRFSNLTELQPYLEVLRREVDRVSNLMGDLLEYGKATALELVPCPIEEPIAQAAAACIPIAESAGVTTDYRAQSHGMALVLVDRARLVQVFQNLLDNAIRYSPPGGVVTIVTRAVDDAGTSWIECEIADRGPGFGLEDLPHVFEPFFTRRHGGTGLGLSIVRRIVEAHGGSIVAANGAQGGAIMTVRLAVAPTMASVAHGRTADGSQ